MVERATLKHNYDGCLVERCGGMPGCLPAMMYGLELSNVHNIFIELMQTTRKCAEFESKVLYIDVCGAKGWLRGIS